MPQVSVVIPSYNHEAFVEECIESVLQQTFQDFEIIITDDGSRDGTVEIIEKFKDPRIKLFLHSENKGACVAANNCLQHSSGQYIANLSSDDVWLPEKLEVQVDYIKSHPEIAAVFGRVIWIDEDSNPIRDPNFPFRQVFDVTNRSRFEWLNHFFTYGNNLCHPSSLIRRECYNEVGLLNPTLANLPDFDLWIRLCLKFDIHILDQDLIKFRRLLLEANASGDTSKNRIRTRYEYLQILNHYLQIKDLETFYKVFPHSSRSSEYLEKDIPFLLAKEALTTNVDSKQLWGLNLIFNQLQDEEKAARIAEIFHYSYIDFIREVASHDVFKVAGEKTDQSVYEKMHDALEVKKKNNHIYMQIQENTDSIENLITKNKTSKRKFTLSKSKGIISIIHSKILILCRRITLANDKKLIQRTGYFDANWYVKQYPDVKESGMEPITHFLLYGGFEGREPCEKFSSNWYLTAYDDVSRSGMNPLLHYLKFGIFEGRVPKKTNQSRWKSEI